MSDLSIDGLLIATWHQLSSMTAQISSLRGAQPRGNPEDRGRKTEDSHIAARSAGNRLSSAPDVSPQIHEEFMKRGKA
jgi:hypothetical protein